MSEQLPQVSTLVGKLVEHQRWFELLSSSNRQWAIANTVDAIGLFVKAVEDRAMQTNSSALACTKSLNPTKFIGEDWSFWRGPTSGNGLDGEIEQDTRSASLTEFDPTNGLLVSTLKYGERSITGEENLARLKEAGHVRLGAKQFLAFWENQSTIPEAWKDKMDGNIRFIYFEGDVLRGPYGNRCVLYLDWHGGKWRWHVDWLGNGRDAHHLSAVLAS